MNAIELLKADHEVVAKLFEKVKATENSDHTAVFEKIKAELDAHMHIEETIFYPKLKAEGNNELVDIVLEGIEEHRQAKMFLKELHALSGDAEKFDPKLKVLIEDIKHHVKEEETTMFPLTKKQFEKDVLDELGAEMEAEKTKFKKSLAASAGK